MFRFFETRVEPFPPDSPVKPPNTLFAFCWLYSRSVAGWIVLMAALSALIAVGEVALFGFLRSIVDWLTESDRAGFFEREGVFLYG